jgi:hypothetical protein
MANPVDQNEMVERVHTVETEQATQAATLPARRRHRQRHTPAPGRP